MNVYELVQKYNSNYSTIRHIIVQYNLYGKTDKRNFKLMKCKIDDEDISFPAREQLHENEQQEAVNELPNFEN